MLVQVTSQPLMLTPEPEQLRHDDRVWRLFGFPPQKARHGAMLFGGKES
jgi:hypothetical protein